MSSVERRIARAAVRALRLAADELMDLVMSAGLEELRGNPHVRRQCVLAERCRWRADRLEHAANQA